MILLFDLINNLLNLLEKAGKIARLFHEKNLLSLLTEEKKLKDKNKKFIHDYKTLADVLIQQMINYHLTKKYPKVDTIKGEENNKFTNLNGLSVEIEINENKLILNETLNLILNNNQEVSEILMNIVYEECSDKNIQIDPKFSKLEVDEKTIGFWIDPIDSTNEYIKGEWNDHSQNKLITNGLACVTCLLGVYSKLDGKAIIGIINLPFFERQFSSFYGKSIWGVDYKNCCLNNIEINLKTKSINKIIAISQTEDQNIIKKLSKNFELINISGVGYKLYLLLTNQIDAYLTTKPTTFKWDTCAANAIINSMKNNSNYTGNLLEFKSLFENWFNDIIFINYEINYKLDEKIINENGLIGSNKKYLIEQIIKTLKQ